MITGDLQDAVEQVGLFYPPDPASLRQSSIGGNVAECAGGPRAFKYGTTKRYVLGLEAVLPTGEIIATGGKAVKNVVGYDLTQLLVGSEGTLAIITKIILRLVPKPPAQATLRATFRRRGRGGRRRSPALIRARVVPAALELIDGDSLEAVATVPRRASLAPAGTAALLLLEVDGMPRRSTEEARPRRARRAATPARPRSCARTTKPSARSSGACAASCRSSLQDDRAAEVQPRRRRAAGRDPGAVRAGRRPADATTACGSRASATRATATSTSTSWSIRPTPTTLARAHEAERVLFEGVVALEGSISGEHGIGFAKAPYLALELSADEIALMKRVKEAFDPARAS